METSDIVGRPLRIWSSQEAIVGAIVRGLEVIIPDGSTVIQPGDRVMIFALTSAIREVEKASWSNWSTGKPVSPSTILNLLGYINLFLAGSMLFPLLVNWIYGEPHARGFLLSIASTALSGLLLILAFKRTSRDLTHRDGFAIVAFGWISATFFGCLPYLFTGTFDSWWTPASKPPRVLPPPARR